MAKTPLLHRIVPILATLGAVGLGVSACSSGGSAAGNLDRADDFSWTSTQEAQEAVPAWLPPTAINIKERVRTAGTERILTFDGSTADLPSSCTRLPIGAKLTAQPEDKDHKAADFRITATLESDWWPAGQEGKTSFMCGHWWVSSGPGKVYAFTPELKAIANRISA